MHLATRRFTRTTLLVTALLPACAAEEPVDDQADLASAQSHIEANMEAMFDVVAASMDADGKTDLVAMLGDGQWLVDYSYNGLGRWDVVTEKKYQQPGLGSLPGRAVIGDYDGDGKGDLAAKTTWGYWLVDYAANGFNGWDVTKGGWGGSDCIPVPGFYDSDKLTDMAIKCHGTGKWIVDYAKNGFASGDVVYSGYGDSWFWPVPADYDGDGLMDLATKDGNGNWYFDFSKPYNGNAGGIGVNQWEKILPGYGNTWFWPVPADYDADGKADVSTKDGNGNWYIDYASNGFGSWDLITFSYGAGRAVPGNFDGTGKLDLAVVGDCGTVLVDTDSVGGLGGSSPWNLRIPSQMGVSTAGQLVQALGSKFMGTLQVQNDIDLSLYQQIDIHTCQSLAGSRGKLGEGPTISTSTDAWYQLFRIKGNDIRVEGLRFRGPANDDRSSTLPKNGAIDVEQKYDDNSSGRRIVIANNEFYRWRDFGVGVHAIGGRVKPGEAGEVLVTGNYFHHNARDGAGYGVVVGSGYAKIFGNTFNYNRHAVAGSGTDYSGYVAQYNLILQGGYKQDGFYNQHFDMHGQGDGGYGGTAGEYIDIGFNTIFGDQTYYVTAVRPAFMLRGTPTIGADFHNNVLDHNNLDDAVALKNCKADFPDCLFPNNGENEAAFHFNDWDNSYGHALIARSDWGVGDFDADGIDDLFYGSGVAWFYSSGGKMPWKWIGAASQRVAQLRFGQFDDVPGTDVFATFDGKWQYSSGGTGPWQTLRADTTPLADLLFGDFDNNGKTDVVWADGKDLRVSWDARGAWQWMGTPDHRASALRVGDFDADPADDIFAELDGKWVYTSRGTGPWVTLQNAVASLDDIRLADFDGNGRTDIARNSGSDWLWSPGGGGPWQTLRSGGSQAQYASIKDYVFGNFYAGGGAEALRFELVQVASYFLDGNRIVAWPGLNRGSLVGHGTEEMR